MTWSDDKEVARLRAVLERIADEVRWALGETVPDRWTCGTCGTSRAIERADGTIACVNGHEVVIHSGMTVTIEHEIPT